MGTCRNATCQCETQPGHDYCCDYCANVDLSESIPGYSNERGGCACGHDHCHLSVSHPPHDSEIAVGPNTMA